LDWKSTNLQSQCPLGPTDWYYQNLVPKDLAGNLRFRRKILKLGYENPEFAREIWIICARDILFSTAVFGWTLNPKEHPDHPLRPFIPYGYQEREIPRLQSLIGIDDVAVPKSRDMGASWMCLIVLEHRWRFHSNQLFLLTSEKEELVDGKSEKALFKKLDFWWKHTPIWMLPNMERRQKHCKNLDNNSAFDGEATVDNMATGDRRTAILMDETSKMPGAAKIFTSTRDVTRCRIFNSTPNGRFGVGGPFYLKVRNKDVEKVFLHWSEHPDKRIGLYKDIGGEKVPLPEDYDWKDDYDFTQLKFVRGNPRSTWYDKQCDRVNSPVEIAQELDIDFHGSAERFADETVIARVMADDILDPFVVGRLGVDAMDFEATWSTVSNGQFKLWCPFDGVRPAHSEFSIGADIAAGTGGAYASNSALVIFDRITHEQVGQFTTRSMSPEEFARFTIGVCKWFHEAFLVPECNGPGLQFMKVLAQEGYHNMYRQGRDQLGSEKKTKKYGYQNQDSGTVILGSLQDSMRMMQVVIRSETILTEMLEYEMGSNGRIFHAGAKNSESNADKGMTHGDVAIAAACGWLGVKDSEVIKVKGEKEPPKRETVGHRFAARDKLNAAKTGGDYRW